MAAVASSPQRTPFAQQLAIPAGGPVGEALPAAADGPAGAVADGAPVNFVYLHVHNAIRKELVTLEAGVKELSNDSDEALVDKLAALKERYTFLERIYKYHSSVEDEAGRLVLVDQSLKS